MFEVPEEKEDPTKVKMDTRQKEIKTFDFSMCCKTCGKRTKKMCDMCRSLAYCSRVCQKKDWKFHKEACGEMKEQQKLSKLLRQMSRSELNATVGRFCQKKKITVTLLVLFLHSFPTIETTLSLLQDLLQWIQEGMTKQPMGLKKKTSQAEIQVSISPTVAEKEYLHTEQPILFYIFGWKGKAVKLGNSFTVLQK